MMKPQAIVMIVLLLVTTALSAQRKNVGKWEEPFNGKNLEGWKVLNGQAKFEVVNGELVGTNVKGEPNSFLVTEKEYRDFILELEFKIAEGTNSGIQFRSESTSSYQDGRVHGYQYEIDPSQRSWTGGIYDEARRQWLYSLEYNPRAKSAFRPGAWNKARIECIGNSLRTFINGVPAAFVEDNMTPTGFIGLQVHAVSQGHEAGSQVRWRNIRIKTTDLQPSPYDDIFVANFVPNEINDQEKKNGVTLLWDGSSTKGWRGAYKDKFPEKGWKVSNGVLTVEESGGGESEDGGDIVTTQEYGAFDLQFEFRITAGANSGVKYFVTEKENNTGSAIGLEYQILDDERHPDAKLGVVGNRTLASLYDLIPSLKVSRGLHKVGEWNYGRIIVYPDNHVEHWLNGYKVLEYERGSLIYQALVARSKYAQWEDFGMAKEGHILLQDHGNEVSFRSIKIKVL